MNTAEARRRVDFAAREHHHHVRAAADARAELDAAKTAASDAVHAQKILQETAAAVQRDAHGRISAVVSSCLSAVFGADAYRFRVVFEQKRGKTEARLVFVRDGEEYAPDAVGGGVLDVAALGLRLAALAFARPAVHPLLVLDEPARMLSRGHAPRFRGLLESVSADMGVQILMVTHSPDLAAGKVVDLSPSDS